MIPRRYVLLIPLAALAACASGSTMRVAQGDEEEDTPVALAPAPESAVDSTTQSAAPLPPAREAPTADSTPQEPFQEPAPTGQAYEPYGSSGGVELRRIGQWTHTSIGEARRLIIRDANTWAEFWSELGMGARPAVDFSRDLVIAVAAGQRSSGGHEIAITQVTQTNGELTIEVVETTPGPNCLTTSAQTQPVDVAIAKGVKPQSWSFVQRREVRDCR